MNASVQPKSQAVTRPKRKQHRREMRLETTIHVIFGAIALSLIILGTYLIHQEGLLNNISGIICYFIGSLLGLMFFGNKWRLF
jgi:hypothetical protein